MAGHATTSNAAPACQARQQRLIPHWDRFLVSGQQRPFFIGRSKYPLGARNRMRDGKQASGPSRAEPSRATKLSGMPMRLWQYANCCYNACTGGCSSAG